MYVNKHINLRGIWAFSGGYLIWLTIWAALITIAHEFTDWTWLSIPWLPISVIGTAVAFYIGFKNNQAYDRLWEARKIWGAIVNSSRAWGSTVKSYVSDQFAGEEVSDQELQAIKRKLVCRHIAWLYTLRSQLLIPTPWEDKTQHIKWSFFLTRKKGFIPGDPGFDEFTESELHEYLPDEEYADLVKASNTATQIIDYQSQDLAVLRRKGLLDDFRHVRLQEILNDFYIHQGKCERIKKFPLPRQYAGMSFIFVGIFIFLLPFGMVEEFDKLGAMGPWVSIPFTVLISWVFLVMELVGDYSENPFQGLNNDIPMLSISRAIEIDLLEMLGEKNLPPAIEAKEGVLL